MEDGITGKAFGYDDQMSSVSAMFKGGERALSGNETFLTVRSAQGLPLEASSTSIRKTLAGYGTLEKLATLPFSFLGHIRKRGLYSRLFPEHDR